MIHFRNSFQAVVFALTAASFYFAIGCSSPTATGIRSTTPIDDTAQVIAAAERDFTTYLNKIPKGLEPDYGFADRSELDLAEVGAPLRVHAVDVDYSGPKPRSIQKIRSLDQWRVPLIVNGEQRVLLTVVKKGDRFETVDFGAAGLARSLNDLNTRLKISNLNTPYLVRVVALHQDFLGIPNNDEGDSLYPASPSVSESTSGPSSSIVAAPTLAHAPMSEAELFSLIDEQVTGGAK